MLLDRTGRGTISVGNCCGRERTSGRSSRFVERDRSIGRTRECISPLRTWRMCSNGFRWPILWPSSDAGTAYCCTVTAPEALSPRKPKPALRVELLFYLTFLVAFALLVGVATSLLTLAMAPESGVALVIVLIAVEVAIFVLYGRSLVSRLVLQPLDRVVQTADAVADGDLAARAPDAATQDFATLAEPLNRMTERLLDAQSQLVRSEKLASIGRLAAGVAHEVGNPLGAIGTYVEVLRRRGADQEITVGMSRELERLDRIVRSLLDYARPQKDPLVPIDPARIVRGAFELLRAQGAFRAVQVDTDIFPQVPEIARRAHIHH